MDIIPAIGAKTCMRTLSQVEMDCLRMRLPTIRRLIDSIVLLISVATRWLVRYARYSSVQSQSDLLCGLCASVFQSVRVRADVWKHSVTEGTERGEERWGRVGLGDSASVWSLCLCVLIVRVRDCSKDIAYFAATIAKRQEMLQSVADESQAIGCIDGEQ